MRINYIVATALTLSLFFSSCSSNKKGESLQALETISVETSGADFAPVDKLFDIEYLSVNLPDSVFLGAITHIKHYKDYFFMLDSRQTKTITVIDSKGNFVCQLNQIGQGPGEYSYIESFAFNTSENELIIYDRAQQKLHTYTFPGLNFVESVKIDRYMVNLEMLDANTLLAVSDTEGDDGSYEGIVLLNKKGELQSNTGIDANVASIEISYHNTFSRMDDEVYYAHPHEVTTVFKMGSHEPEVFLKVDFGKNGIPLKYWSKTEANQFEASLEEGNKATWVQHFITNPGFSAFWYMYKEPDNRQLAIANRKTGEVKSYAGLSIPETEAALPYPIGVANDAFISILSSDELDLEAVKTNEKLHQLLTRNKGTSSNVLVVYTPKK